MLLTRRLGLFFENQEMCGEEVRAARFNSLGYSLHVFAGVVVRASDWLQTNFVNRLASLLATSNLSNTTSMVIGSVGPGSFQPALNSVSCHRIEIHSRIPFNQ